MPQKVLQRTYSTRFNDFALEFYSFVADNYAPFYSRPVECTDRDAPFVLDGVLYHECDLNLEEHYPVVAQRRARPDAGTPSTALVQDVSGGAASRSPANPDAERLMIRSHFVPQ